MEAVTSESEDMKATTSSYGGAMRATPTSQRVLTAITSCKMITLTSLQSRNNSLTEYIQKKKHDENQWSPLRRQLDSVLQTTMFNWCLGAMIVFNIFLIVLETDLSVSGDEPAAWISISDRLISAMYFIEVCVRVYAHRLEFFGSFRDFLDVIIVVNDIAILILDHAADNENVPSFGFLKMFRMIRLVRVIKLLTMVPELQLMIKGFAFAVKPIAWGMVMIVVCLLMWSILGVQFIHPLVQEAARDGAYDSISCHRCERAFSSVAQTMLTFTQTLIAGDDWGQVTIPVMEAHPEAYLFFLCALMTTSIGLLNLILAVIVDSAMQARKYTDHELALEKEFQREQAKDRLLGLCELLDKDRTGDLTLEELQDGMQDSQDFADAMKAMDICADDMSAVFHILDQDKSGTVHYQEFVNQMHSLKTNDSHTLLMFIKYYTKTIHDSLLENLAQMKTNIEDGQDAMLEALQVPVARRLSVQQVRSCMSDGNRSLPLVRSSISEGLVQNVAQDDASEGSGGNRSSHREKVTESEQEIALDPTTSSRTGSERIEADLLQLKANVDISLRAACDDLLRMLDIDELRSRLLTLPLSEGKSMRGLATSGSAPMVPRTSSASDPLLTQRSTWSQRPLPPTLHGGLGPLFCKAADANMSGGPAHDN